MKSENLSSLESFPYFTIEAEKQLLGDESAAAGTIQTALYRWMKSGQIIQLKKDVYMTRRFFEQWSFIKAWLDGLKENFREYVKNYY